LGPLGGVNGAVDVLGAGEGDAAQGAAVGRIDVVERLAAGGVGVVTVDEKPRDRRSA